MAKKIYAVKSGRNTGLFDTWDECKAQVDGYSGAEYKGFSCRADAEAYLGIKPKPAAAPQPEAAKPAELNCAYVDGSYNPDTKISGYGGFVIDGSGKRHIISGTTDDAGMTSMRNVAGEILGAMKAAEMAALKLGMKELTICYDYQGIESWFTGEWKTNKPETRRYVMFLNDLVNRTGIRLRFVKVKGHTGVEGNEEADILAKRAVGVL